MTEKEFNPQKDGWDFRNWPENEEYCIGCGLPTGHTGDCEFDWKLYHDTYLGISETDLLDIAFFEIFKKCAKDGNCGGMSHLALALFKYGGYMGFCSPATFYEKYFPDDVGTEIKAPADVELHRAINILQARQFGSRSVMHVIDLAEAGNTNDAELAYKTIEEHLAKGDYCGLSIAKNTLGTDGGHTVVPYKVEDDPPSHPGKKVIHIYDPNYPYNDDPTHYNENSTKKLLVITKSYIWEYKRDDQSSENYESALSDGAWCFAMPMSLVLPKSRQPMTLENFSEALITIFASAGSAVSQISDSEGHRFYTKDVDVHTSRGEIETDPKKRLKGAIRWPWFFKNKKQEPPGELYFIRRHKINKSPLITTVNGTNYNLMACMGKNLIEITSNSNIHSRETIKTSGSILDAVCIEVTTTGKAREMTLNHSLMGATAEDWRKFKLKSIQLPEKVPITISMEKKMNMLTVASHEKEVKFDLEIQQCSNKKISSRKVGTISTVPGKTVRLAPKDWKNLGKTELRKQVIEKNESESSTSR